MTDQALAGRSFVVHPITKYSSSIAQTIHARETEVTYWGTSNLSSQQLLVMW
jgi:hypothetical protein